MKKVKIIVGRILYTMIGKHLPVAHCFIKPIGLFSKKFREFCGRMILEECGRNVNIYPKAEFSSKVKLGENSDIGYAARINGTCIIEKDVIMGPEVLIYTVNHASSRTDVAIKYQGLTEEKPVIIGEGSWICARAIILPGVCIGKNVIVAAGAVVSKSVPDYAIVAGNPAVVVKQRNEVIG
jgi:maltose O-acetyltransferase